MSGETSFAGFACPANSCYRDSASFYHTQGWTMKRRLVISTFLALSVWLAAPVGAEQYSARSLTTEAGELDLLLGPEPRIGVPSGGLAFAPPWSQGFLSSEAVLGLAAGASYGIVEDLEVGLWLAATLYRPNVLNPQIWSTYRFYNEGGTEVGGRLRLTLPFNSEWIFAAELPTHLPLADGVRLEVEPLLGVKSVGITNFAFFAAIARLSVNFTPEIFATARVAIEVNHNKWNTKLSVLPALAGGYTVMENVDIVAFVELMDLYTYDSLLSDFYETLGYSPFSLRPTIGVGVNMYDFLGLIGVN